MTLLFVAGISSSMHILWYITHCLATPLLKRVLLRWWASLAWAASALVGSSQRCPGLDSRWLPAFALAFIFTSKHLNSFISSVRQDALNSVKPRQPSKRWISYNAEKPSNHQLATFLANEIKFNFCFQSLSLPLLATNVSDWYPWTIRVGILFYVYIKLLI